jgi:hypothetical protein
VSTFALGIPHTPWVPARVESLRLLEGQLGTAMRSCGIVVRPCAVPGRVFAERTHNCEWSRQMWSWAAEIDATHFLQLQDDVVAAHDFWAHLHAMIDAVPDKIVGLESVHPSAVDMAGNWYTTSDGLIGVGYVVPMPQLREFLEWRATRLCKGAVESITEDTLLCTWALSTGRRIYHPVPTIIDHDITLKSTYGNDAHQHRRPLVTWRDRSLPLDWAPGPHVPHLGQFYGGTVARLARRWVIGATDEDWDKWRSA